MIDERPVAAEHDRNMGFVEGPGNQNPWTREMGIGDTSYCDAGASLVPHHNGVTWWPWCQFGEQGSAYCPYHITAALRAGHWRAGARCVLEPMALVFYSWNGDDIADHVETVKAVYDSPSTGTFDTWAYNAGTPQGAHVIHRDRKYVLGCIPMRGVFYGAAAIPQPSEEPLKLDQEDRDFIASQATLHSIAGARTALRSMFGLGEQATDAELSDAFNARITLLVRAALDADEAADKP